MTTWHDVDKMELENKRLADEVKNAKVVFREYISSHTADNGGKQCHCHTCKLAEAWLQRNR